MNDVTPPAGTPPAGTPPAGNPPAGTPPAGAPPSGNWYDSFKDENKAYVQKKGFASPEVAMESYINLEKLVGVPKEKLLRLPDNMDDAKALSEIHSRLGRPEKPEGYKIQEMKGADKETAAWMEGTFHEAGLSGKQAALLAQKLVERTTALNKADQQKASDLALQQESELKTKWGAAYDQNRATASRAATEFGLDGDTIDKMESAMGFSKVMDFLHAVGSKMGEPSFQAGKPGGFNGAMTPIQANDRIKELSKDIAFVQKLSTGDVAARTEWDRLHKFAYPG